MNKNKRKSAGETVTLFVDNDTDVVLSPSSGTLHSQGLKEKNNSDNEIDSGHSTPNLKDDFDDLNLDLINRKFSLQEDKLKMKMIPEFELKRQMTNLKKKYQREIQELKDEIERLNMLLEEESKKYKDFQGISKTENNWTQREFEKKLKEEVGAWIKRVENLEKKNKEYREIIHKAEKDLDKKLL